MLLLTKSPLTTWGVLSLFTILLLPGSPSWAGEPRQPVATMATEAKQDSAPIKGLADGQQQAAGHPTPIAAQGMRVYRDPKTGQLGAPPPGIQPPGLSAKEQQMLSRSDRGLQARTLPNGAVAVDLQGRFRSMAVATMHDGNMPAVQCVVTPREADVVLQSGMQTHAGQGHDEH
jgi:hypothetical protein